jgi:hypothetical protein
MSHPVSRGASSVRKIEIVKAEGLYFLDPPDRSIESPVLAEEDTCMSCEQEDTCMLYEEEDTCMSHEEEDTCMSYEEEDTCMSCEEEDTCMSGASRSPQLNFGSISSKYGVPPFGKVQEEFVASEVRGQCLLLGKSWYDGGSTNNRSTCCEKHNAGPAGDVEVS